MLRGTQVSKQELVRLRGQIQGLVLPYKPAVYRASGFRSLILGRGMEYEKSRKYEAGDDVRMIDWRVTARTGTTHTKVFQEDRQRTVYLIVDLASSMRFGTRVAFKSVVAAEAAALIAWSAYAQGDLVSIIGVSDDVIKQSKPAASPEALIKQLDMLAALSQSAPPEIAPSQPLAQAISVAAHKIKTGDLVVIFGDLSTLSDVSDKDLRFMSRHQSLIVCWIQDTIERTALPVGHYPVTDGTRFTALHLSSSGRRKRLQSLLNRRNQEIAETLRRFGVPNVQLTCGDEVVKVLHRAFHQRRSFNKNLSRLGKGGFTRSKSQDSGIPAEPR